jgi:transposase-like protein
MNTPNQKTPETPEIHKPTTGRRHARYSDAFKRQVIAACQAPGVSTATVAQANGLNANMLRRWVAQASKGCNGPLGAPKKPLLPVQANPDSSPSTSHRHPPFRRATSALNSTTPAPPFKSTGPWPLGCLRKSTTRSKNCCHIAGNRGKLNCDCLPQRQLHLQCVLPGRLPSAY